VVAESFCSSEKLLVVAELRPCLNPGCKVLGCHIGCYVGVSHESVRIVIIEQITEALGTPRDEYINHN
jgi:hypothetical protein